MRALGIDQQQSTPNITATDRLAVRRMERKRLSIDNYIPSDPESFSFHLQLIAGPESEPGEESFDIQVCTPKWLLENHKRDDIILGRHYLIIVMEYNYERLLEFIRNFCSRCEGTTWTEVAEKLGRLGYWEFEDYQE